MKWAVGALAVLLAASIALGTVLFISMRSDISALQHPSHHLTPAYATTAETDALSSRLNLLVTSVDQLRNSDETGYQGLAQRISCLELATFNGTNPTVC